MTEPTVADELEWSALPEETRARYLRVVREELYEEISREVKVELDGEDDALRTALEEISDIVRGAL